MKGVVSKERDRKAECIHGDNNRLQFCGAPSCRATQQRASEQYTSLRLSRTSNTTARNSQSGGESSAGKAAQEKQKCKAIPRLGRNRHC